MLFFSSLLKTTNFISQSFEKSMKAFPKEPVPPVITILFPFIISTKSLSKDVLLNGDGIHISIK